MSNICDALPQPKKLHLGGEEYLLGEMTLSQISEIQHWVNGVAVNPLTSISQTLKGLEGEDRRFLLAKAYEDAKNYPPKFGTKEADDLINTAEGMAETMYVLFKPHNPDITREKTQMMVSKITMMEWQQAIRTATGTSPLDEIEGELTTDPKGRAAGRRTGAR